MATGPTRQSAHAQRPATVQPLLVGIIAALGLISAALYYAALVRPYLLTRWVDQPLADLGKIGGYDPEAGRRFALPLLALWLLYLLAWGIATRLRGERAALALAAGGALGSGAVLLWLYPITAADIFNYVIYGLVGHAGGNPLVVAPNTIIGPPTIDYSAWPFYPSPYGPAWQGLAWLVTAATGERLLAGILLFKGILLAAHLLNTALIAQIAARGGVARPGGAALAYAWNPLLLYEVAGNGHNDIVMLTGLLLALLALTARRADTLTLPLATLAALTKAVGALWLAPLALAWLPRAWAARRARAVLVATLLALGLIVVAYLPYWDDGRALDGLRRQSDLHTSSLAGLLILANERAGLPRDPRELLDRLKEGALAIVALTIVLSRPRDSSAGEAARAAFDATLAYLLVGALWFQPWYLVPLVGLAPLVGPARRAIAVAYAVGATGSYVVYFYLWPSLGWETEQQTIQRWAVGVAHGPAWVALALAGGWALWRGWARRPATGEATGAPALAPADRVARTPSPE